MPMIGAPYTGLMRPAKTNLTDLLKEFKFFGVAHINVYSNYLGRVYPHQTKFIREAICNQFDNPIKWEQIMQVIYRKHQVSFFIKFYVRQAQISIVSFYSKKRRSRKPGK
jgi:hypothetical protein